MSTSSAPSQTTHSTPSRPGTYSEMRFARFLFILSIIGVISSIVMATKKDRWDPLTDKVMEDLSRLQCRFGHQDRHETEELMGRLANLQLNCERGTMPPVLSQDQASTSRLEIDGEERHETLGTVNFIQSQKNPVAWLKALLSDVVFYEKRLRFVSSSALREDKELGDIINKEPWHQDLIRKRLEAHNERKAAKRRLKKVPKEKKMIKNLLKDVKAALPVARRRRARTRTRTRQR